MNNLIEVSGNTTALTGTTTTASYNKNMFQGYQRKFKGNTRTQIESPAKPLNKKPSEPLFRVYNNYTEAFNMAKDQAYTQKKILGELATDTDITIIFGVTNCGKSTFARQLAEALATGQNFFDIQDEINTENQNYKLTNDCEPQKGIYIDFENSIERTYLRYSGFHFSENIIPLEPVRRAIADKFRYIDEIDRLITQKAEQGEKIGFVIIDNITNISQKAEERDFAIRLMDSLNDLRDKHKIIIVVLAHSPKGCKWKPKEEDNVAGSSNITNFTHNIISIGHSRTAPSHRYIKQIKAKIFEEEFGEDNVILMKMEKQPNGFLGFSFVGYENENALLKETESTVKERETEEIINRWKHFGMSAYEIGKELYETYGKDISLKAYQERIKKRIQRLILREDIEPQGKNCDDKNSENRLKNPEKTPKNPQKTAKKPEKWARNERGFYAITTPDPLTETRITVNIEPEDPENLPETTAIINEPDKTPE